MQNTEYLKAVPVTKNVYWVGAVDWNVTEFHGYKTERGSTYNAYLVLDDKITLIDTVKAPFKDHLLARIASVIDPEKIDYIISNHAEPDHSGSLPDIIKAVKPEKVFASIAGQKALDAHYRLEQPITPVKTGDEIHLGRNTVKFIETKMLHWPDSMISYLTDEKILFSQDAFGMHLAGSSLFADQYDPSILEWEAKKYFANILLLYAEKAKQLLAALPSYNLDIRMLAPDHGPIWRRPEDIAQILQWYGHWAAQPLHPKALVVFDTMWHSTEKMAYSIGDGLRDAGVTAELIQMSARDRSYVATEVIDAGAIVVGSPTLNNNIFPSMADVLTYLKGLRPQHRIGAAFGSYGWSGEAVKQLEEYLAAMNVERVGESIKQKYVPLASDLEKCYQLGRQVGEALLAKIAAESAR